VDIQVGHNLLVRYDQRKGECHHQRCTLAGLLVLHNETAERWVYTQDILDPGHRLSRMVHGAGLLSVDQLPDV